MSDATSLSPLIHLVDDDEAVRASLALLIGTVGLRVQTWHDPADFLSSFEPDSIGAIVLDIRMPGTSGLNVLETLVARGIDHPVIMLTGHGTVDLCRRAFKTGAAEFLEKPVDDDALLDTLQRAVATHVHTREHQRITHDTRARFGRLSRREREVLGLIVAGLTNKEMARAMDVTARTVEAHRANLFAKLETKSLAQLIRHYAPLVDEDVST